MARHRLVTIGDSITQGVRSGAIVDGSLAWPTFLARAMGIEADFSSPTIAPERLGPPINLEYATRDVLAPFGSTLSWYEVPRAAFRVRSWMDDVEDAWERSTPPSHGGGIPPRFHNLAILGFDLRDALVMTADEAGRRIDPNPKRNFIKQIPQDNGLRVAREVLRSAGPTATVFDAARMLADDGGIEVLVVMLGANNALGVASELKFEWSAEGFDDLDEKGEFTLWTPEHFAEEYELIAEQAASVGAEHTILATVPKVTIAPIARGVGEKVSQGSRYFEHYTRPWIGDDDFDERSDPFITDDQARRADEAIDAYNATIAAAADERGPSWHVFDLASLLDSMATRRYIRDDSAQPEGFEPYEWPPPLDELDPPLETTFFAADDGERTEGGIFSLDGIHPTVVASALIAHEMVGLLRGVGVDVPHDVDLDAALAADELNTDPPEIVGSVLRVFGWLDQFADVVTGIARFGR